MDVCSNTEALERRRYIQTFSIRDIRDLLRLDGPDGSPQKAKPNPQFHHRRIQKGSAIYRQGQPFESLYIVQFGCLKTVMHDVEGTERVLSFPMKGSILGFDGIWKARYNCEAIALTDCQLILIPFEQLLATKYICRVLASMGIIDVHRKNVTILETDLLRQFRSASISATLTDY